MILVDSSSWIHMLRPNGDAAVRDRVTRALDAGEACWCPIIRLELWNGAGGDREKKVLRDFERLLPELAIESPHARDTTKSTLNMPTQILRT